ncbi:MAG: uracil-DNA glycosylase [Saprospiraceae bacterium]|nr:uracil-DNA glycosylase [Saprospiraceae bacterium]
MESPKVKIEESWYRVLREEFDKQYFSNIVSQLKSEKAAGKIIYPPGPLLFNAFEKTPFDNVKVIIIGQDPYHNPGQAMGLCFSVPKGIKTPASLVNIYKELKSDLCCEIPPHGDLSRWAEQGVFLLNAMLSVEQNLAGSHKNFGWQDFTDSVIKILSKQKSGLVFLLWGNFARNKRVLIDSEKHLILESAHPSPLAGNAFQGNKHFSKTNQYLITQGKTPINWQII